MYIPENFHNFTGFSVYKNPKNLHARGDQRPKPDGLFDRQRARATWVKVQTNGVDASLTSGTSVVHVGNPANFYSGHDLILPITVLRVGSRRCGIKLLSRHTWLCKEFDEGRPWIGS